MELQNKKTTKKKRFDVLSSIVNVKQ